MTTAPVDHEPVVAGIVPDLTGLDRVFDYLVPVDLVSTIEIGSKVRVSLNGRRVGGWVVSLGLPSPGVSADKLKSIDKSSGIGPDAEMLDLCRWASVRWCASRLRPFLVTASPHTVVTRPAPLRRTKVLAEPVSPAATKLLAEGGGVLQLPPSADHMPTLLAAARVGPALVVCASVDSANVLAHRLRRAGISVALMPEEWALARGGVDIVIGARAAAFAPCPELKVAVVLDEHEESLQEERAPTWHARDVLAERCRRADAPLLLVSPCPSVVGMSGRKLVAPSPEREKAAWPVVEVVDQSDLEPWKRSMLSSELIGYLRHSDIRVACVLNTKGQARLLACRTCHALTRCEVCQGAMVEEVPGRLDCGACGATRPRICNSCGSSVLSRIRPGVARLRDELEATAQRDVLAVVAGKDKEDPLDDTKADVFIGTEAVLHRVRRIDVVAFLDFDSELLAPRYRASEQAFSLIARAARLVGPRDRGGRVVLQTSMPDHEVVRAAVAGDPSIVSVAEMARRQMLGLPPASAIAIIEGDGADVYVGELAKVSGMSTAAHRDKWMVRAANHEILTQACANAARPANSKIRIEVDPPRI
jgi:primosomal protein N' (replication factor Y)